VVWQRVSLDLKYRLTPRVKVWKADGSEVTVAEGPFVLWDTCLAGVSKKIIDFGGESRHLAEADDSHPIHRS
jgi:hypothetical protein